MVPLKAELLVNCSAICTLKEIVIIQARIKFCLIKERKKEEIGEKN